MCIRFLHTTSYYNIPTFVVKDFFMEVSQVDKLIDNVSKATDDGDYKSAVNNLSNVLEHVEDIYGETIEIEELKQELDNITELLN